MQSLDRGTPHSTGIVPPARDRSRALCRGAAGRWRACGRPRPEGEHAAAEAEAVPEAGPEVEPVPEAEHAVHELRDARLQAGLQLVTLGLGELPTGDGGIDLLLARLHERCDESVDG